MNVTAITGDVFLEWFKGIVGSVFIAILMIRSLGYYLKKEWGELTGHLLVAIIIAGLVYFPDQFIEILKGFWNMITGQ